MIVLQIPNGPMFWCAVPLPPRGVVPVIAGNVAALIVTAVLPLCALLLSDPAAV